MTQVSSYEQQAIDFMKRSGIAFETQYFNHRRDFVPGCTNDVYKCRFYDLNNDKTLCITFTTSVQDTKANKPPTAYDILACITKSDPGTFKDFCSDFGYDSDSRKAFQTYQDVCAEWQDVRAFFTDKQLEELQEIN